MPQRLTASCSSPRRRPVRLIFQNDAGVGELLANLVRTLEVLRTTRLDAFIFQTIDFRVGDTSAADLRHAASVVGGSDAAMKMTSEKGMVIMCMIWRTDAIG